MPYRIMIIGSSCSGKTTHARQLGERLGIKHIDLDDLNWLPNWQSVSDNEMREKVSASIKDVSDWVISGGYSQCWDITMPRASHVVFLDLPLPILIWRLLLRSFRRIATKEKVCNGNVETLSNFLSKDSLFLWQLKNFKKKKRKYAALKQDPYNPETKFIRFTAVRDIQTFINAL